MRVRLFSLPGVDPAENNKVSMLLVQSLFLGIFIGAFDISAHSLFLAIFDEKVLAKGYIASGFSGIILLTLYFIFQGRMNFRSFAVLNLLTISIITLILWISIVLSPDRWMIFLMFIMFGPLNIIAVVGFRTTIGHLLTLIKDRKLFAVSDTALIIGIVIGCLTIPVLLSMNFKLHNFLLVSALSVGIAAAVQVIIGSRLNLAGISPIAGTLSYKRSLSVLKVFRKDQYARILGVFIIISVVSALFVQYSFLSVTRTHFPAGEDMAGFLGILTGSIMILTLLGKLILFPYLLKNYGLRICLTVSPMLLAVFTAMAIISGMMMGYTTETASGFMIFFFLLALLRFLSKSMEDSVEFPSMKVLCQTFEEKSRFEVQTVMDSTVREIAVFLAGLILAGVGLLSFVSIIHFSWVLFIILMLWLLIAFKLYAEYRKQLRRGLDSLKAERESTEGNVENILFSNRFFGERAFHSDYFNLISGNYSLFEKMNNRFYFKKIIDQTVLKHDISLFPLIKKMASGKMDDEIRKQSAGIVKNISDIASGWKQEDDRTIPAKRILSETRMPQTTEILRLLGDKSIESKRLAIYMIGKFGLSDMLPEVCECFNIQGLETDVAKVLASFGSRAEAELIRFYLVSSGNINTGKTILRLLAKLPSVEAAAFMFSRLWSNSRQLKEVALSCLIESGFQAFCGG